LEYSNKCYSSGKWCCEGLAVKPQDVTRLKNRRCTCSDKKEIK
jgi:hypothetical protein